MNAKKNLGNRIKGWFPKQAFGISSQADVYSEWISAGKFVKAIAGSISVLATFVLALAVWFSISIKNPLFAVVIALPLIFVLVLYVNYRR